MCASTAPTIEPASKSIEYRLASLALMPSELSRYVGSQKKSVYTTPLRQAKQSAYGSTPGMSSARRKEIARGAAAFSAGGSTTAGG